MENNERKTVKQEDGLMRIYIHVQYGTATDISEKKQQFKKEQQPARRE